MKRVSYSGARRPKPGAPQADLALFDRMEQAVVLDVLGLPIDAIVVHGAEPTGVDAIAAGSARETGRSEEAHPPKPEEHGGDQGAALLARNAYVTTVDEARFFAAPWSRGTWDAWRKAERARIPRVLHEFRYDGGVRVTRWPPGPPQKLRIRSANARSYAGPGRLDVTRGSGKGAGLAFAPTNAILKPALAEREKARVLLVQADKLITRIHPTDEQVAEAATLTAQADAIEDAAWATYEPAYVAEMRVSAGMRPEHPRWGDLEEAAARRGVRPQRDAWKALLSGQLGSYDTDGAPLVTLCCYCAGRWLDRGHCHRVVLRRLLTTMGAEDGGEARGTAVARACARRSS